MPKQAKENSKAPAVGLTIRAKATRSPGASHTQRNGTSMTQETTLASNNEPGRAANGYAHASEKQNLNLALGLQSQTPTGTEGSTKTTHADASETACQSSDTDSIELKPDPNHPHARAMHKDMQVLHKPFDGKDDQPDMHYNGRA